MKLILTVLTLSFAPPPRRRRSSTSGLGRNAAGAHLTISRRPFRAGTDTVVNDGCTPVIEGSGIARPSAGSIRPIRSEPGWTAPISSIHWNVNLGQKAKRLTFAVTDAFDQPERPQVGLGVSHFTVSADGGPLWTIAGQSPDHSVRWLSVIFDTPQTGVNIAFDTRHNDGFG